MSTQFPVLNKIFIMTPLMLFYNGFAITICIQNYTFEES